MQVPSRFTIAIHMLVIVALEGKENKITSDFLASSVGVNPVIIRKTLSQLKKQNSLRLLVEQEGQKLLKILKILVSWISTKQLNVSGKRINFSAFMIIQIQIVQLEPIFMGF